jgi:hypothetical protein
MTAATPEPNPEGQEPQPKDQRPSEGVQFARRSGWR